MVEWVRATRYLIGIVAPVLDSIDDEAGECSAFSATTSSWRPTDGSFGDHVWTRTTVDVHAHVVVVEVHVRGLDSELAAAQHGVLSVDDEIHEHLLELTRIREDRAGRCPQEGAELDGLADESMQHRREAFDDAVDTEAALR